MKELSIRDKARRYDEAIKIAKEINNEQRAQPFNVMTKVFSELAEPEDEKIRKAIIEFIKVSKPEWENYSDYSSWIAWLEKQVTPQTRTGDEWVNMIDDACDKRYSEEYARGEYCHEQSFKWGFQEGVEWLEKQDEQSSVIRWYDASLIPQEGEELLVEWNGSDAAWHEIAFYHADTKTFWNGERHVEDVTRWCYIDDLLGKQGKKVEPIEGFNNEFERQISHLIASIINKEHEYTEAFVKWTSDALLNYAKHEIENRNEQKLKKVSLWKHWKNGIAGNGEGKLIYLVREGNTYSLSSCLGFECDYIELSELDSLIFEKQCEQKPVISDEAIREGVIRFGITQYQINNWLKKYVDVEEQGRVKESQISRHENETCEENDDSLTSEDEKVRKTLIHIVKGACDKYGIKYQGKEIGEEKLLSWLEKQGDKDRLIKELGEYKVKYTQGVLEQHLNSVNNDNDNERLIKTTIAFLKEFADKGYENAAECIDWLEKQGKLEICLLVQAANIFLDALSNSPYNNKPITDAQVVTKELLKFLSDGSYNPNALNEQNPVEWFEPKFHDGDWVTENNGETVFHITIDKNMYQLETIGGTSCHFSYECIEEKFRLWNIQDAKDGDVLASKEGDDILIFRKIEDNVSFSSYCNINKKVEHYWSKNRFMPATKEQRDLLFKKMKEAGYRWDEEKLELKKIKQKQKPAWNEIDTFC